MQVSKKLIFFLINFITVLYLPESAFAGRSQGDWATSCQRCHGSLETTNKRGRSVNTIQAALNRINSHQSVRSLTSAQVDDIAVQLGNASTCIAPKSWNETGGICSSVLSEPENCILPTILDPKTNTCQTPALINGAVGKNGSGLAKTDVYQINCPNPTTSLFIAAQDLNPIKTPFVSIQSNKSKASTILSTDPIDGDNSFSPLIELKKGYGIYTVSINKSAYTGTSALNKGIEIYTALFSCQDQFGKQTNRSPPKIIQNQ